MKLKHLYRPAIIIIAGMLITVSCKKDKTTPDPVPLTVVYDNFTYHTVTIGNQVWMVENLRTKHYRDGSEITNGTDVGVWTTENSGLKGTWCKYAVDEYGLLYNWYAVTNGSADIKKSLAPAGWHIPTQTDWDNLAMYLGIDEAGKKMKDKETTYWGVINNGTNTSGFRGLPGGYLGIDDNNSYKFNDLTMKGIWWSSSPSASNVSYAYILQSFDVFLTKTTYKNNLGLSVRCIRD